jgi:hypothetical protein
VISYAGFPATGQCFHYCGCGIAPTAEQFAAYGSNIAPHQTESPTTYSTNYFVAQTE